MALCRLCCNLHALQVGECTGVNKLRSSELSLGRWVRCGRMSSHDLLQPRLVGTEAAAAAQLAGCYIMPAALAARATSLSSRCCPCVLIWCGAAVLWVQRICSTAAAAWLRRQAGGQHPTADAPPALPGLVSGLCAVPPWRQQLRLLPVQQLQLALPSLPLRRALPPGQQELGGRSSGEQGGAAAAAVGWEQAAGGVRWRSPGEAAPASNSSRLRQELSDAPLPLPRAVWPICLLLLLLLPRGLLPPLRLVGCICLLLPQTGRRLRILTLMAALSPPYGRPAALLQCSRRRRRQLWCASGRLRRGAAWRRRRPVDGRVAR